MPRPKRKPTNPKRPRGRPVTRIIGKIDATPEELVQAMFRVADRERDERLKKSE